MVATLVHDVVRDTVCGFAANLAAVHEIKKAARMGAAFSRYGLFRYSVTLELTAFAICLSTLLLTCENIGFSENLTRGFNGARMRRVLVVHLNGTCHFGFQLRHLPG